MHQLIRRIEEKVKDSGSDRIEAANIRLAFINEDNGSTVAQYESNAGIIVREDKEWTLMFEADGESHTFPIAFAFEAEMKDEHVILQYDSEDDEYVVLQFDF